MFPLRLRLVALVPATLGLLWLTGCSEDQIVDPGPTLSCDPGDICTVMGTGQNAYLGEGAPPEEVALYRSKSLYSSPSAFRMTTLPPVFSSQRKS